MKPDPRLVDFSRWNAYLGWFLAGDGRLRAGLPIILSPKSDVRARASIAIDFYLKRGLPPPATLGVGYMLYDIADGRDPSKLSHTPGRLPEARTLLMAADYFIRSDLLRGTGASEATICRLTANVWGRDEGTVRKAYNAHKSDVHSLVFTWLAAATREYHIPPSRQLETLEAYLTALAEIAPDTGK